MRVPSFWKQPPSPVCKVNTGRIFVYYEPDLVREKYPFNGHFGNTHEVILTPELEGGGGGCTNIE